jgi:hypothetical protein
MGERLDYSIVKRNQELKELETLKNERDPSRIYNSKIEYIDKPKDVQITKAGNTLISNREYNRKLPQLVENATVTIIKDNELLYKAGGYNFKKVYSDLAKYARLGLYHE